MFRIIFRCLDSSRKRKFLQIQDLMILLFNLTEHHARLLLRVGEHSTRKQLARMVVERKTSVRELGNIITRLRCWFSEYPERDPGFLKTPQSKENVAIKEITGVLVNHLKLAREGNSEALRKMHLLDEGFTMYDDMPPHTRLEGDSAFSRENEWLAVTPELTSDVEGLKIDVLGDTAVATMTVLHEGILGGTYVRYRVRGTTVLILRNNVGKLFHDHWSKMDQKDTKGTYPLCTSGRDIFALVIYVILSLAYTLEFHQDGSRNIQTLSKNLQISSSYDSTD